MASGKDEVDKDDGEAMWAPHRRPTFPLDAPALARHLVMRMPVEMSAYLAETDDGRDGFNARRERLIKALNDYLDRLQNSQNVLLDRDTDSKEVFRPRFITKRISDQTVELTDTLFFRMQVKNSLQLGVRIDAHNEYMTVTLLAESLDLAHDDHAGGKVGKILGRLAAGDQDRAQAELDREYLYMGFWDDLTYELGVGELQPPGMLLADFRGFIVCTPSITQPMDKGVANALELRSARLEDRREKRIDYDVFHFIKRRPIFFGTILGLRTDPSGINSPANVPVSGALDGAAIYGSTLRAIKAHELTPLRYFVVYNGNSRSQLGRLIRRLNVLGELRIAAMMDTPGLRRANRRIRELTFELDKAGRDDSIPTIAEIRNFNKKLADADKGTSRDGTAKEDAKCSPGAIYRVERSRYYAQSYKERLQDLRIVRVEGWQPYDTFMRRNLFMEFDYVSQIGDRFANALRKIERLGALVQITALQQNNLRIVQGNEEIAKTNAAIAGFTKETAKFTKAMAAQADALQLLSKQASDDLQQLKLLTDNISDAQEELLSFQAVAEPVGVGAFAYYVGSGVSKVFEELTTEHHGVVEFVCILGAGLFYWFVVRHLALWFVRNRRNKRNASRPKSSPGP